MLLTFAEWGGLNKIKADIKKKRRDLISQVTVRNGLMKKLDLEKEKDEPDLGQMTKLNSEIADLDDEIEQLKDEMRDLYHDWANTLIKDQYQEEHKIMGRRADKWTEDKFEKWAKNSEYSGTYTEKEREAEQAINDIEDGIKGKTDRMSDYFKQYGDAKKKKSDKEAEEAYYNAEYEFQYLTIKLEKAPELDLTTSQRSDIERKLVNAQRLARECKNKVDASKASTIQKNANEDATKAVNSLVHNKEGLDTKEANDIEAQLIAEYVKKERANLTMKASEYNSERYLKAETDMANADSEISRLETKYNRIAPEELKRGLDDKKKEWEKKAKDVLNTLSSSVATTTSKINEARKVLVADAKKAYSKFVACEELRKDAQLTTNSDASKLLASYYSKWSEVKEQINEFNRKWAKKDGINEITSADYKDEEEINQEKNNGTISDELKAIKTKYSNTRNGALSAYANYLQHAKILDDISKGLSSSQKSSSEFKKLEDELDELRREGLRDIKRYEDANNVTIDRNDDKTFDGIETDNTSYTKHVNSVLNNILSVNKAKDKLKDEAIKQYAIYKAMLDNRKDVLTESGDIDDIAEIINSQKKLANRAINAYTTKFKDELDAKESDLRDLGIKDAAKYKDDAIDKLKQGNLSSSELDDIEEGRELENEDKRLNSERARKIAKAGGKIYCIRKYDDNKYLTGIGKRASSGKYECRFSNDKDNALIFLSGDVVDSVLSRLNTKCERATYTRFDSSNSKIIANKLKDSSIDWNQLISDADDLNMHNDAPSGSPSSIFTDNSGEPTDWFAEQTKEAAAMIG